MTENGTSLPFVISEIPDIGRYCKFHKQDYVLCERHLLSTMCCDTVPKEEASKYETYNSEGNEQPWMHGIDRFQNILKRLFIVAENYNAHVHLGRKVNVDKLREEFRAIDNELNG
jgi:hypothetical protein